MSKLTDRELLEICARVCAYKLYLYKNDVFHYEQLRLATEDHWSQWKTWDPLENAEQALRLANKQQISIIFTSCSDGAPIVIAKYFGGEVTECNFPDPYPYKATCRAIVKAVVAQQLQLEEYANGI